MKWFKHFIPMSVAPVWQWPGRTRTGQTKKETKLIFMILAGLGRGQQVGNRQHTDTLLSSWPDIQTFFIRPPKYFLFAASSPATMAMLIFPFIWITINESHNSVHCPILRLWHLKFIFSNVKTISFKYKLFAKIQEIYFNVINNQVKQTVKNTNTKEYLQLKLFSVSPQPRSGTEVYIL